jgi:hypothetical protein
MNQRENIEAMKTVDFDFRTGSFYLVKNLPDIPSGFSTRYSTSLVIAVLVASFRAFVVVVIHASWLAGYSGRRPRDGPGSSLLWRVSI